MQCERDLCSVHCGSGPNHTNDRIYRAERMWVWSLFEIKGMGRDER